jgi:hypothetical protein
MKHKQILLKGEGTNQHVLHGSFEAKEAQSFLPIVITKDSLLKHEEPGGSFAEHNTLPMEKGNWVMGKQVEYNPFKREVSQVWD